MYLLSDPLIIVSLQEAILFATVIFTSFAITVTELLGFDLCYSGTFSKYAQAHPSRVLHRPKRGHVEMDRYNDNGLAPEA